MEDNLTSPYSSPQPASRNWAIHQLFALTRALGWTPTSYFMLSFFFILLFVISVVWWPLVQANLTIIDWSQPLWLELLRKMDWLLLFDFVVMTLLIMARADFKADILIVGVGFVGGLVIESWGTQTHLWNYFTLERPPLWIIPAWPIASLSIDRLYRFFNHLLNRFRLANVSPQLSTYIYWPVFLVYYALMFVFVKPTLDKSLTISALILCAFILLTPSDKKAMLLTFAAGTGLGYFLELWGTTRQCWIYYTLETPPLFAVLAHGMAAVAFWRAGLLFKTMFAKYWPSLRAVRR